MRHSTHNIDDILSEYVDWDTKPCEDFYKFVCGNQKNQIIPPGYKKINDVQILYNQLKTIFIKFLEQESEKAPETVKKARKLYALCMNREQLENFGLTPVSILLKILNLPTKPPFIGKIEDFDLGEIIGNAVLYAEISFPFRIEVDIDPFDKLYNRLIIKTPTLESISKITDENEENNQKSNELKSEIKNSNDSIKQGTVSLRDLTQNEKQKNKETNDPKKGTKTDSKKPVPSSTKRPTKTAEKKPTRNTQTQATTKKGQSQENSKTQATTKKEPSNENIQKQETTTNESLNENQKGNNEENAPLLEYITEVANIFYEYTNNKLKEDKKDIIDSVISQVSQLLHGTEKLVSNFDGMEKAGVQLTLKELQEKTDSIGRSPNGKSINWFKLFDVLFHDYPELRNQFERNRKVYIENMNYYENLIKLLINADERILYSAIWWNIVRSFSAFTTEKMEQLENKYRKQVGLKIQPRNEFCMETVVSIYDYIPAYNLITSNGNKILANQMLEVYRGIYPHLRTIVEKNSFMEKKTIMVATKKLQATSYIWAYNNFYENAEMLDNVFTSISVFEGNFFFTILNILQSNIKTALESLTKQNAKSYTIYFKYGTLGFMLSREEFHSIDTIGNQYNLWGRKNSWWSSVELRSYTDKAMCYVESYNELKYPEVNKGVNGQKTLEQNIADNVGFKAALASYVQTRTDQNGILQEEKVLPSFSTFSSLQLFTIAWARSMCQIETTAELKNQLMKSKYAPHSARVRGVVMNSQWFSKIWKCKNNNKMNPDKKCDLW
ncbi:hypothetical protein PGB90_002530 [Kerria lacca]